MLKPTSTAPPSTPAAPEPDDQKIGDGVPVVDDRDSSALSPTVGRYRPHARPGRTRQVRLRYTSQEYEAVARAANAAGLTTTGYVAEAALAAAAGAEPPVGTPWREALTELMAARAQVRRIGLNINQATRVLNATGEQPVWLEQALAMAEQAVIRLDDAATDVADTARRHRLVHPRRPHKL